MFKDLISLKYMIFPYDIYLHKDTDGLERKNIIVKLPFPFESEKEGMKK